MIRNFLGEVHDMFIRRILILKLTIFQTETNGKSYFISMIISLIIYSIEI